MSSGMSGGSWTRRRHDDKKETEAVGYCANFAFAAKISWLLWLELNNNQLNGSIPSEIGNLTKLRELRLYGNQLTGSIPQEIGQLTSLQSLWLHDNKLTGAVPPGIFNLTRLTSLRLSGNNLSGPFPNKSRNLCIQSNGIPDYGICAL